MAGLNGDKFADNNFNKMPEDGGTNGMGKTLSIMTWNINGIRASKIPLKQLLDGLDSDIICLQETKVTRDQLDEQTAIVEGYNSYFSFSKVRSGYSGVATFVRDRMTPIKAEQGLTSAHSSDGLSADQRIGSYGDQAAYFTEDELTSLDKEGRTIITEHTIRIGDKEKSLVVINVYCPRADPEKPDRLTFKLRFYQLLQLRAEELIKQGRHVIILGDLNTSHKTIDHCNPDDDEEFYLNPGRKWMDELLFNLDNLGSDPSMSILEKDFNAETNLDVQSTSDELNEPSLSNEHHKFVDTYRLLHPTVNEAFTNWCTLTGARATNYGCRLDYVLADRELASTTLQDCIIMPEVQGSDHCPVRATLCCTVVPAKKCPPLCTRYMPEFAGRQQKLRAFLTKKEKSDSSVINSCQPNLVGMQPIETVASRSPESSQQNGNGVSKLDVDIAIESSISSFNDSAMSVEKRLKFHNSKAATMKTPLCKRASTSSSNDSKRTKIDNGPQVHSGPQSQGKLTDFVTKKDQPSGIQKTATAVVKQSNLFNFFTKGPSRVGDSNQSNVNLKNISLPLKSSGDKLKENTQDFLLSSAASVAASSVNGSSDLAGTSSQPISDDSTKTVDSLLDTTLIIAEKSASTWRMMLKGPPQAPLCSKHNEPCVLRDVKKDGPNKGRQFFVCNRPEGHKTNPAARCEYFSWVPSNKR